jgi:hypothetical protein
LSSSVYMYASIVLYVNLYMYASIVLNFRGCPAYPFPGLVWERCEGACFEWINQCECDSRSSRYDVCGDDDSMLWW